MEAMVERACGLDVHKDSITACVVVGSLSEKPKKFVRQFRTFTRNLIEMRDWIASHGCTHVAMESTGVYWRPVHAILEGHFDLTIGNAHHMKNVPGRKTDMKDSEWIANLVRHGLVAKSFVPPKPIRELRDLTRYRKKLAETESAERNRLQKLLEQANVKLASVASDVFGVSGRAMIDALIEGVKTPAEMAQLAKAQLRKKLVDLELALEGKLEEHHAFILRMQLRRIDQLAKDIDEIEERIAEKLRPYTAQHSRLMELPGVDFVLAATMLAELGPDMSVFQSEKHVAAWAGVCPGNNESAGKQSKAKSRKGNIHLKTALYQAASGAARVKDSYFKAKFGRLRARRGPSRAYLAVGHKLLIAAYHMLKDDVPFKDLGANHLDRLDPARSTNTLVRRLEALGFTVTLTARPQDANAIA